MSEDKVAFALGGLAGNNAFGVGFLQAALERGVEPAMISCTSGQIYWVYEYLRARERQKKGEPSSLRETLRQRIKEVEPFPSRDWNWAKLAAFGKQDVCRPAYAEFGGDFVLNALDSFLDMVKKGRRTFVTQELLQMLPCRALVPDFPPEFFTDISKELAETEIGIVFNSYRPSDGHEYVHLNEKARNLLASASKHRGRYDPGCPSSYRSRTFYQDILPGAVEDGLWVYQYGFDRPREFVDGAYYREIILSELTHAHTIYAVRPVPHKWIADDLPRNWPEFRNLETEVGFNGAYVGERDKIRLVNKLIENNELGAVEVSPGVPKYHTITLKEMEPRKPRGFFDYVFEDMDLFDDGYEQAAEAL